MIKYPYWRKLLPEAVKNFLRRHFSFLEYDKLLWLQEGRDFPFESDYRSKIPLKLGIIKDYAYYHTNYIIACRELNVCYKVIDIFKNNWIEEVTNSNCDAFLVWPSVNLTIWKQLFDERLKIMVEDMGKIIYPSYKELWLYENKRRVRDWLVAHNIPHPKTWIFYNLDEAINFLKNAKFPLVRKTALGGASHGVKIVYSQDEAIKEAKKAINKGIVPERFDKRDKQWGYVIFQQYIPHEYEWRIVRIGDWYLYRKKIKIGDFASGSGKLCYEKPNISLLEFVRNVTDKGGLTSMAVDIFVTGKDEYLVNELQTVFGAHNIPVNENTGRYIYNYKKREWVFEQGDFYKNNCANLRVEYLIKLLLEKYPRKTLYNH